MSTKSTFVPAVLASVADYMAADTKGKAAIRKAADDAVTAAIKAGGIDGLAAAQSAMAVRESYTTARATSTPVEIDWTALVADRIATLNAAVERLVSGNFDGAPDGFVFDGSKSGTVDESALAGLTKVRRSARRDLGSMIESVVTGDFQTVAQIRAAIVAATDGDYVPSDGAVAARLFPANGQCTLTGVAPVDATNESPRGAVAVHVED